MNILSKLFTDNVYAIGYRTCDNDILDNTSDPFKVLMPTKERWYADPFPYEHNGEYYVFMEIRYPDKLYAELGYSKLVDGKLTEPKTVIDYGKHLSFPFIFDYNGETYIMPESCSENKIKLFRCVEFPEKWEECFAVSDDRGFYDTVPFEDNGRRYLFTSHSTSELYGSRLYLMELDDSDTELKIKSEKMITDDNRCSRQAGKMLRKDGKLIRVAQDCSKKEYGRALEFYEVENLENYSEHLIRHINPKDIKTDTRVSGKTGIHTYNRVNDFEVIDLKISKFYPKAVFIKTKMAFDMIFKR